MKHDTPQRRHRELLWDRIATDAAGGAEQLWLARKYGRSPAAIRRLLRTDQMQGKIAAKRSHYLAAVTGAQVRAGLTLPELIQAEIDLALPVLSNGDPDNAGRRTELAQKSRQFLIRQVWPQTTQVEQHTTLEVTGPVAAVATEIRNTLVALQNAQSERRRLSILDSPHVHEGEAALPRALPATTEPK